MVALVYHSCRLDGQKQIEMTVEFLNIRDKLTVARYEAIGGTVIGNGINGSGYHKTERSFAWLNLASVEYGVNNWRYGKTAGEVEQVFNPRH